MMKKSSILAFPLAAAVLTAGCATTGGPDAQQALQQVRDEYAAGNYGDVIRTVATSAPLAKAPDDIRVEALKLQAFSYCVTQYTQLCQDGFVRILRIEPSFMLAPNEAGHPLWGPVFKQAQVIAHPPGAARLPLKGATPADRQSRLRGGSPPPRSAARLPLKGATPADRQSRLRGVPDLATPVSWVEGGAQGNGPLI